MRTQIRQLHQASRQLLALHTWCIGASSDGQNSREDFSPLVLVHRQCGSGHLARH